MRESAVPEEPTTTESLSAGRAAFADHAWPEAFDLLSQADRAGGLSGADLELFSQAAFFVGSAALGLEVKERAFKARLAAEDQIQAAYLALDIAHDYGWAGKSSIASAWGRRGQKLLENQPESYAHAYLALVQSEMARAAGKGLDEALELAESAVKIATRAGHADLQAAALTNLGSLRIASGATSDGIALMEEASIAAVNGELSPIATGVACCRMIAACRDLTDYRRASEWTEATEKWCERQSVAGFPGVCRIHRAEVVAIGGAWDRAERELRQAADELAGYNAIAPLADGLYALGEIRRLKGDLEGAEAAFREAHGLGRTPQPGLALIRLAEGKVSKAAAAINSALKDETWDQWARVRLLPAQVEIAIAAGDRDLARSAAVELGRIIESYKSPALEAGRRQAMGRVLLADGDAAGAAQQFRAAIRDWREVAAPYEVAKGQALLARALRALDDDDAGDLELEAARAEFERLGARPDAAAAEKELRASADRRSGPVQSRKTFMFTDIVGSTNLAELLGNDSWERLLRWHDDMLRALVATSGGEVVNSTGDGFFVAFDNATTGLICAIAIQRALAEHRRTSGFAISVRIGLHSAEANRRGDDYSGLGVHLASRVAALATGGEIVATAETLADASDIATSDVREASLKGVTGPVTVASVTWG
jgi:class 3 adenylate cyclase